METKIKFTYPKSLDNTFSKIGVEINGKVYVSDEVKYESQNIPGSVVSIQNGDPYLEVTIPADKIGSAYNVKLLDTSYGTWRGSQLFKVESWGVGEDNVGFNYGKCYNRRTSHYDFCGNYNGYGELDFFIDHQDEIKLRYYFFPVSMRDNSSQTPTPVEIKTNFPLIRYDYTTISASSPSRLLKTNCPKQQYSEYTLVSGGRPFHYDKSDDHFFCHHNLGDPIYSKSYYKEGSTLYIDSDKKKYAPSGLYYEYGGSWYLVGGLGHIRKLQ